MMKMKKQTKILYDGKQTRTTIPKELVEEHKVTTEDSMEWESKNGKLKGELKKK